MELTRLWLTLGELVVSFHRFFYENKSRLMEWGCDMYADLACRFPLSMHMAEYTRTLFTPRGTFKRIQPIVIENAHTSMIAGG